MPGFWEYLQQFSDRDAQRRDILSAKQLDIARMLGEFAQNDAANTLNYAQLQNSGLATQGGLLQGLLELQQGDRKDANILKLGLDQLLQQEENSIREAETSRRNNKESNAAQIESAKINASSNKDVTNARIAGDLTVAQIQSGWTISPNGTKIPPQKAKPMTPAFPKPKVKPGHYSNQGGVRG